MIIEQYSAPTRRSSAVTALAAVGLVSLIGMGVWGGVYSSRYVPEVVNRLGAAAVYLGSSLSPAPTGTPSEVATSTEETVISFGTPEPIMATTTEPRAATSTPAPVQKKVALPPTPPALHGSADLTVSLVAIGYLRTDATDSFVASTSVPSGAHPAIRFTIKNAGTNASGTWSFDATIPTRTAFTYHADPQISLLPGESMIYTLGFDRAAAGTAERITITLDPAGDITETSETNNTLVATLNTLGS